MLIISEYRLSKQLLRRFLLLCVVVLVPLLSACQDETWQSQQVTIGEQVLYAEFPQAPTVITQDYHLLAEQGETEPLRRVQWYAADGEGSFSLSYIQVPPHLEPSYVAQEMLRSMNLKRDPLLENAPAEVVEQYERDLPAIGERFLLSVNLNGRSSIAEAQVLQVDDVVVQLYTVGPDSNHKFQGQVQRFFEQLRFGDTIP